MGRILLHNAKVYVEKGVYAQAVLTDGGRIASLQYRRSFRKFDKIRQVRIRSV